MPPTPAFILCGAESQLVEAEKILTRPAEISADISENSGGAARLADFEVSEKSGLVGKNLRELALPKNFGIKVMGVLCEGDVESTQPDPNRAFVAGDRLLCMGTSAAFNRIAHELKLAEIAE